MKVHTRNPTLMRPKQENHDFDVTLAYIVSVNPGLLTQQNDVERRIWMRMHMKFAPTMKSD